MSPTDLPDSSDSSESKTSGAAPRPSVLPHTDLVATLTAARQIDELDRTERELLAAASWLEVRADLVGELDVDHLRQSFSGQLIFTLRSKAEGGACERSAAERRSLLTRAAERYDLVDLEIERDVEAADEIAVEQRLLSWHDAPARRTTDAELNRAFARSLQTPARFRKLICSAHEPVDALVPIKFLAKSRRSDLTCFAMGDVASWTRIVAPRLGSVFSYGGLGEAAAPGQFGLRQLIEDYGLPTLRPVAAFYGIVGDPVSASLSPRLHNGAYRDLELPACYLPFRAPAFGRFWLDVVESPLFEWLGAPLQALSVTAPHKSAALALAGASSPRAQAIDSANTLVRRERVWQAESTDPEGISYSIARRREPLSASREGMAALVLGSGGAGRAAVLGLRQLGAEVVLANRTEESGAVAAERFGVQFLPLSAVRESDYDVLVNATALGRSSSDRLPFDPERCREKALVVDMVYGPRPTALEQACEHAGIQFVSGREVLLMQAVKQFETMTGESLPVSAAARRIGLEGDFEEPLPALESPFLPLDGRATS